LAVQAQIGDAPAHLLPVVRRIGGIRQRGNDGAIPKAVQQTACTAAPPRKQPLFSEGDLAELLKPLSV
jgi:hypothetical protein